MCAGLVAHLHLAFLWALHLLMENPLHPSNLCFTVSLWLPSPWLRSPVIRAGFCPTHTCWNGHTLPLGLQTHRRSTAPFPDSISDSSSSSPCSAPEFPAHPPCHKLTQPMEKRSPWSLLLPLTLAPLSPSPSQLLVQPETETNLRPEQSEIISYAWSPYMTTENLLIRAPNPAFW